MAYLEYFYVCSLDETVFKNSTTAIWFSLSASWMGVCPHLHNESIMKYEASLDNSQFVLTCPPGPVWHHICPWGTWRSRGDPRQPRGAGRCARHSQWRPCLVPADAASAVLQCPPQLQQTTRSPHGGLASKHKRDNKVWQYYSLILTSTILLRGSTLSSWLFTGLSSSNWWKLNVDTNSLKKWCLHVP